MKKQSTSLADRDFILRIKKIDNFDKTAKKMKNESMIDNITITMITMHRMKSIVNPNPRKMKKKVILKQNISIKKNGKRNSIK